MAFAGFVVGYNEKVYNAPSLIVVEIESVATSAQSYAQCDLLLRVIVLDEAIDAVAQTDTQVSFVLRHVVSPSDLVGAADVHCSILLKHILAGDTLLSSAATSHTFVPGTVLRHIVTPFTLDSSAQFDIYNDILLKYIVSPDVLTTESSAVVLPKTIHYIAVDRNCDTFAAVELTKRYFIPDILSVEAGTELQVIPLQRYILVPSGGTESSVALALLLMRYLAGDFEALSHTNILADHVAWRKISGDTSIWEELDYEESIWEELDYEESIWKNIPTYSVSWQEVTDNA